MFPVPGKQRLLAGVLAVVLVGAVLLAGLALAQRRHDAPRWRPDWSRVLEECTVREPAPETDGEDLDGRPLRLSDYRGRVVVVCFWVEW
jgi:cytochrome oxidase Cu insertion factor (SCO1/SenC/PrrC family)